MRKEKCKKYLKTVNSKPHKISVLTVMMKDRVAKLPKEERREYLFKKASKDYKNLTSEERQEYESMAEECNKKRMKVYETLLSQPKS